MQVVSSLPFASLKPETKSLRHFVQSLQTFWQGLTRVINGNLGFGDGTHPDNISGVWITAVFTTPNVDTPFTHNLGRVPVGYIVMAKAASSDVYTGGVAWTKTQITLRATIATTVTLFVI